MTHEATIRNLDQEQSRLKEKISRLEEEREALLNQSQVANEQHKQQVHKLEQVLPKLHLSRFRVGKQPTEQTAFLLHSLCVRSTRVMRRSSPG